MENRYDKYKDSGIEWIGEIPEHWEVTKIQYLAQLKSGYNLTTEEITDCALYPVYGGNGIRGYYDKYFLEGDYVLIGRQGALCGNINYSIGKSWATEHAVICYPKTKYITKWFGELLRVMNLNQYSLAAAQPGLAVERIKLLPIPIIPLPEQQSIATYLDQKCSEIDEQITLQEEMITKLQSYKQSVITEAVTKGLDKNVPLKDSGIEWIGEIPEHWDVKRLKFSCNVFGRIGFRGYKSDDLVSEGNGAITLSPSNMKDMKMDYTNRTYLSWKKYYESPEIMISKNDILMVKTGSTYGKCSFVDDIPMECTINPQIVVFKQHKDYPKFLAYSFQTNATRSFVETSVVGGTIPTIAQEKIMNYFFAFPPLPEQQSIADYLDKKCSEIDELITIKQQKIEKLKDYKKSLIFECVTGKRKVS